MIIAKNKILTLSQENTNKNMLQDMSDFSNINNRVQVQNYY